MPIGTANGRIAASAVLAVIAFILVIATFPGAGPVPAAHAQEQLSAKDAFSAAKELGTREAWDAFLQRYPDGFLADLARAYIARIDASSATPGTPPSAQRQSRPRSEDAAPAPAPKPAAVAAPVARASATLQPAVSRGARYMGFSERFNRYYSDRSWKPRKTIYVSPDGGGDGTSREAAASVADGLAGAEPGTLVHFVRGKYSGCFDIEEGRGGTYDQPLVLFGERGTEGGLGVTIQCCAAGRKSCLNVEGSDYVAIDGFELAGGNYGVRAVGRGFAASEHSRGVAVMNCKGHDQDRDPFFTGQSDWFVLERNVAYGAKKGDGHGIYLSNGGDWNIVRFNETYGNHSSDFQINPDPDSTCKEVGIPFDDPRCDAYAGEGEGGQGASDYFLIEGNYFHHSLGPGPNFTSLRRSIVRNNIFGPQARHNASFWQETGNPKLGSSGNKILHNIFLTTARHAVKFDNHSSGNTFANNIVMGIQVQGRSVRANPAALLMEIDATSASNTFASNIYLGGGRFEGREPVNGEIVEPEVSPAWFKSFPVTVGDGVEGFAPTASAPFLDVGAFLADAPTDRSGARRGARSDLGPFELP
ncbi:MAG: hypothetical protein AB7E80_00845 [Hyphomicrobiaceae bacterium]